MYVSSCRGQPPDSPGRGPDTQTGVDHNVEGEDPERGIWQGNGYHYRWYTLRSKHRFWLDLIDWILVMTAFVSCGSFTCNDTYA